MADNQYDRVTINARERPLSTDINQAQSNIERTLRFTLERLLAGRASAASDASASPISGFVGEGFKARPDSPPSFDIIVTKGLGFFFDSGDLPSDIDGISGVDDLSSWKPLLLLADTTFTAPPDPSSPDNRIDIIEIKINRRTTDPTSRDVLNTGTGKFEPATVDKTLAWDLDASVGQVVSPASSTAALSYKAGVAGNPGIEPPTTAGYKKIAEVFVDNGVATLDADVIKDLRKLLFPYGMGQVSATAVFDPDTPANTSLVTVIAPPGVRIVALTDGTARVLYVLAGDVAGIDTAVFDSPISLAIEPGALGSIETVGASLQAKLQGTDADPATKVAIGQDVIRAQVGTNTAGAGEQHNIMVAFRPEP